MKVRIGTRGSRLARLQAHRVSEQIRAEGGDIETEMVIIETSGDKGRRAGNGVFVKEINRAVYKEEVDIGVHSLKDLSTDLPDSIVLASFPERLTPNDVLVSKRGESIQNLPSNSVIGTGSPRRRSEISHLRPDLRFKRIRGNVDTRIRKIEEGNDYDALITSMAALERLSFEGKADYEFSFREVVPAAGQGTLGVVRRDDERMDFLDLIDDEDVRKASICERAFLNELGLGCKAGAGAVASLEGDIVEIIFVLHEGGNRRLEVLTGQDPKKLGKEAARRIKDGG